MEKDRKHRFWYGIWEITHYDKNGKVIWQEIVQNALADGGENLLLDEFFRNQNAPASFYLGLCNDTLVDTDGLVDILNEPPGTFGYARSAIPRSTAGWPTLVLDSGDYMVTSSLETFAASGGDIGPVNTMFLTNVASGTSGVHIAWASLSTSRTIANGESLGCKMKIKLQ